MKTSLITFTAAAIVLSAACTKESAEFEYKAESNETGTITLNIARELSTKADSPTTELDYEKSINSVQVLVFDASNGKLNIYKNLGSSTTGSISTTLGAKKVWVVANGPDLTEVMGESELTNKKLTLSSNSKTSGFVMAGSAECTVTNGGNVACNVTISRLVARVTLSSITNSLPMLYGAVSLKCIYLANVVGNQNIGGNQSPTTWLNKEGRANETPLVSSHIIDGVTYMADNADLTFKSFTNAVGNNDTYNPNCSFYTYANNSTVAPTAFSETFSAQRSVLVIVAEYSGKRYYYPVVLDKSTLVANTSYNVDVTITGSGSSDPNTPVEKGSISVSISVDPWTSGASYSEIL